jgi:imidazolonepropionase-like amidohydrolase
MAHAQGGDGIKNAVRAGIRSIDHGIYLDDEAIERLFSTPAEDELELKELAPGL